MSLLSCSRGLKRKIMCFDCFPVGVSHSQKYISLLGINSLIREAMQAESPASLSNLCYKSGLLSRPYIKTMYLLFRRTSRWFCFSQHFHRYARILEVFLSLMCVCFLISVPLPLLFLPYPPRYSTTVRMTMSHPTRRETSLMRMKLFFAVNLTWRLANAALVSMCCTGIGSVRGYDELYPRRVDLVKDTAVYSTEVEDGLREFRTFANSLHEYITPHDVIFSY